MAISGIEYQLADGDEAAVSIDRGGGLRVIGGGQEQYLVEFQGNENPSDRKFIALDGIGWGGVTKIPPIYSVHDFNPWIFVVDKRAVPFGGPFTWMVTVIYETIDNPLEIPPVFDYGHVISNEPIERDAEGMVIASSSDELFDPPVTDEVYDQLITITRNEEFYDSIDAAGFINRVNETEFLGHDPELVRLVTYNGTPQRAAALNYFQVTRQFQVRSDGWKKIEVDKGFKEKVDGGGYAVIKDNEGNALPSPTLLDGSGKPLPEGDPIVALEFSTKKEADFNAFGLA